MRKHYITSGSFNKFSSMSFAFLVLCLFFFPTEGQANWDQFKNRKSKFIGGTQEEEDDYQRRLKKFEKELCCKRPPIKTKQGRVNSGKVGQLKKENWNISATTTEGQLKEIISRVRQQKVKSEILIHKLSPLLMANKISMKKFFRISEGIFKNTDPINDFSNTNNPSFPARARLVIDPQEGLLSKILMIRQAKTNIDFTTFIFRNDEVGYLFLNELRKAIKRGVSVRVLIDSFGSIFSAPHNHFKSLLSIRPGKRRDNRGRPLRERAHVAIKTFSSPLTIFSQIWKKLSQAFTNDTFGKNYFRVSRRLHDKYLLTDGLDKNRALLLIGGRNMRGIYYGLPRITKKTYHDLEIFVRNYPAPKTVGFDLGTLVTAHFNKVFYQTGTHKMSRAFKSETKKQIIKMKIYGALLLGEKQKIMSYLRRPSFKKHLQSVKIENFIDKKALPKHYKLWNLQQRMTAILKETQAIGKKLQKMKNEKYLSKNLHKGYADFVYDLQNYSRTSVPLGPEVGRFNPNVLKNGNSTERHYWNGFKWAKQSMELIFPYFWFPYHEIPSLGYQREHYYIQSWLYAKSARRFELVTNSVGTADNPFTQPLIDFEVAPLFHTDKKWPGIKKQSYIWAFGKLDGTKYGGPRFYGKLHTKSINFDRKYCYVGSHNFDPRSRYHDTESGIFIESKGLCRNLGKMFDQYRDRSYRWGTENWRKLRNHPKNIKSTRALRHWYNAIKALGITYLI